MTSRPNFCPCTSPLYQITLRCSRVSVTGFRPVHLPGPQSRPVSCYAFFEGWLLLSPPPGCLRLRTQFHVSLSRYLGTLTLGWIHFLMDPKLTPEALNPSVYDDRRFGVQQGTDRFPGLSPQLVALPHNLSQLRSCCDKFREEPAISSLDWPFTPIRRSSERFAHHYPFGPPPPFRGASTCPRIDQLASGIPPVTPGERTSHLAPCGVACLLVSL